MRKFLVVLLALGLVFAFTAPAFATDASFSGYYRLRGFWTDNASVSDNDTWANSGQKAFYDNRLRVQTVFNVAEGLTVTGRFHAMDRVWGDIETLNVKNSNTTVNQAQNFYWHRAYMTFKTAIGKFDAGYQSGGTWGTIYGDGEADGRARIKYTGVFGPVIFLALTEKFKEKDFNTGNNDTDADWDSYALAGIYRWEGGQAGLLLYHLRDKSDTAPSAFAIAGRTTTTAGPNEFYLDPDTGVQTRPTTVTTVNTGSTTHLIPIPFFKATFGPVYLEGEFIYFYGETDYDNPAVQDVDWKGKGWYLFGKVNLGPASVGAQYAFREGDDPTTNDYEAGYPGSDYNPCVYLWNDNAPDIGGAGGFNKTGDGIDNASLFQVFAGFSPMEKLNLKVAVTYAWADYVAAGVDDEIGTEFDIEATYKIFDNLEYWIGFGYLMAGDWYKGATTGTEVDDSWLIMHKLQMNF